MMKNLFFLSVFFLHFICVCGQSDHKCLRLIDTIEYSPAYKLTGLDTAFIEKRQHFLVTSDSIIAVVSSVDFNDTSYSFSNFMFLDGYDNHKYSLIFFKRKNKKEISFSEALHYDPLIINAVLNIDIIRGFNRDNSLTIDNAFTYSIGNIHKRNEPFREISFRLAKNIGDENFSFTPLDSFHNKHPYLFRNDILRIYNSEMENLFELPILSEDSVRLCLPIGIVAYENKYLFIGFYIIPKIGKFSEYIYIFDLETKQVISKSHVPGAESFDIIDNKMHVLKYFDNKYHILRYSLW